VTEANGPTPQPGRLSRLRVVFTLLVVISLGALLAFWLRPVQRPPASRRVEPRPAPAAAAPSSKPAPAPPAPASDRLNTSVDVVHKHVVGSCEGKLFADVHGLRYETSNRDDGFSLAFADLETFTLDYVEKTLRVKKRAGRTWNFTTRAANADPLLVFQRDVDRARARLAH
jgi:hypothetical protein